MSFFEFPHTRTYDSDLGWIIRDDMTQDEAIANIKDWIRTTQPTIDDLNRLYEAIISGNLPQGMIDGIIVWMDENALDLVGQMVKHVYFGLNDAGYFIVTIPENWKELVFNTTGLDIDVPLQPEYGHLTISY